jgi:hypothetical protein
MNEPIGWGSITESLILFAAAEVPGAAEVIKIIKALAGIEDTQAVLLQRVGHDVRLIRLGPFHSAREHLETAGRNIENPAEYEHHLREAQDRLIDAVGRCDSPVESSVVRFNLGVVAAVRGNHQEARVQLHQAYEASVKAANNLNQQASNLSDEWVRALAASVVLVWPAPVLGSVLALRAVTKINKAQQVTETLKMYVPFAKTVAQAYNTFDPTAEVIAPRPDGLSGLKWADLKPKS